MFVLCRVVPTLRPWCNIVLVCYPSQEKLKFMYKKDPVLYLLFALLIWVHHKLFRSVQFQSDLNNWCKILYCNKLSKRNLVKSLILNSDIVLTCACFLEKNDIFWECVLFEQMHLFLFIFVKLHVTIQNSFKQICVTFISTFRQFSNTYFESPEWLLKF